MRPVERGADPGPFTDYKHAAPHLRLRLGDYCSYCERQIETHLAVEHLRPKSHDPGLRNTWSNFLLACVNCNSCKCDTPINLQEYLWPDVDNTMLAFQYEPGGIITASVGLSAGLVGKAQETIRLLGLDMYPGNPGREPSISDQRWLRRQQAWQKAERYRTVLAQRGCEEGRALIVDGATGRGEFSIWWAAFHGDADMRRRLREAFVGTAHACFDGTESLVARNGGQL